MRLLALAFLSGIPALVYQVGWTRAVALAVGGEVEAISAVLVAFFGGLALGSRVLGQAVDRARSPLRWYASFEAGAAVLALISPLLLGALGREPLVGLGQGWRLALVGVVLLPPSFLLGGTQPALLRAAVATPADAARGAGRIVGWNTGGAVVGALAGVGLIPLLGLSPALWTAAALALVVATVAAALARGAGRAERLPPAGLHRPPWTPLPAWVLAAAALAGAATLAFEVLVARAAALRLGTSLVAWGAVLALTLVALALGNLMAATRAGRTRRPALWLGALEVGAGTAALLGLAAVAPSVSEPASGLAPVSLARVAAGVLPAMLLAGAAFPFFVRLGVDRAAAESSATAGVGEVFGAVAAANTAGGMAGALLASFALLPGLGLAGAGLAVGAASGALGLALLAAGGHRRRVLGAAAATALLVAAALPLLRPPPPPQDARILALRHGRQASAAVIRQAGRRDLYVDGELEASTAGDALLTERLLAVLPLALHPAPRRLLEVGLGSGITLGTAAAFSELERIECVEIAGAVIELAPYFAPQNRGVASGDDPRVQIHNADGRAHLAGRSASYDVVIANTIHPWSVGATGLYSAEYFRRIAGALAPAGLVAQWLPVERMGGQNLEAILRTFFSVFPHGELYWGTGNLIALGSGRPVPEPRPARLDALPALARETLQEAALSDAAALRARRLAGAAEVRAALGSGPLLSDERPLLELRSSRLRAAGGRDGAAELSVVLRIAERGASGSATDALRLWIESRAERRWGRAERADRLEALAEDAGFPLARRARARRRVARGQAAFRAGRPEYAARAFREALALDPGEPTALFGLAAAARVRGEAAEAERLTRRLVTFHPDHAEGWNLLAALRRAGGDMAGARKALAAALAADPFYPEALANAGLLAVEAGDREGARRLLARLRELSPRGTSREERALERALEEGPG